MDEQVSKRTEAEDMLRAETERVELQETVLISVLQEDGDIHQRMVNVEGNEPRDLQAESDQPFLDWMTGFGEIDGYGEVPLLLGAHWPFLGPDDDTLGHISEDFLRLLNFGSDEGSDEIDSTDFVWPRTPSVRSSDQKLYCCICIESLVNNDEIKLNCSCIYCINCFRELIELFRRGERFPPCCWGCGAQEVLDNDIVNRVFPDLLGIWMAKSREVGVNAKERVYCSSCGMFRCATDPDITWTHCFACGVNTCTMCKGPHHFGTSPEECPKDEGAELVHALAKQEGWQTCPECGTVGELLEGCYHISCACGANYCYHCAAIWKSCSCSREGEMFTELKPIEYNPLTNRPPTPPPPQRHPKIVEAEAAAARFELQQTCIHPHFKSKGGRHMCAVCLRDQRMDIYICDECALAKCRRCRDDTWCVDEKDDEEGQDSQ